jgi:hypothetical protein
MDSTPLIDHWKILGFSQPNRFLTEEDFNDAYCKKSLEWHRAHWHAYQNGSEDAKQQLLDVSSLYPNFF